jgi:hypothetical protein
VKVRDFEEFAAPIRKDPARRANIERHRREAIEEVITYQLAELRQARQVTQAEIARALGTQQPGISRLEPSSEPLLSTLRSTSRPWAAAWSWSRSLAREKRSPGSRSGSEPATRPRRWDKRVMPSGSISLSPSTKR